MRTKTNVGLKRTMKKETEKKVKKAKATTGLGMHDTGEVTVGY